MAIVAISRGSYSRGKEVAERVAERLGYQCISREVIIEASREFNIPEIKDLSINKLTIDQVNRSVEPPRRHDRQGSEHFVFLDACYLRNPITGGEHWAEFNHGKCQMLCGRRSSL